MSERILLVQLADIGDLIITLPAIAALRQAQPSAHLTLLTTRQAAPIVDNDLVNDMILFDKQGFNGTKAVLNPANLKRIYDLRHGQYDTLIFFHHFTLKLGAFKFWLLAKASRANRVIGLQNGNAPFLTDSIPDQGFGAKHQTQYWLDLVGVCYAETRTHYAPIPFDEGVLPLALKRQTRIIIHAGGGNYSQARRWSSDNFAALADQLQVYHDAEIVLVGTANDHADDVANLMIQPCVNLSGQTSLTQLADVIRSADVFIGTDSGVTHLAAAVRTPVVAIYGPTNHQAWQPYNPNGLVTVLRSVPECSPCIYVGHSIGLREGCPAKTCMTMVTPATVFTATNALLSDTPFQQSATTYPHDARSGRDWQQRIQVLGLPVDHITYDQWMTLIHQWVTQGKRTHHVCTINPEFMIVAQHDPNFANILKRADLCVPDGTGILWAADILKTPLPERVTGSDGVPRIAQEAAQRDWKLFFLGAAEGVAAQAATILTEQYTGLQVVGSYSGSPSPQDEAAIVQRVNDSGADILLVAYGAPQQDKWIARNMPRLNVKMAMGVGGTFDFIVGKVPRAPQWMQDYRLEWLYRLYKEPWRIWRMLRLPRFVLAVLLRGAN